MSAWPRGPNTRKRLSKFWASDRGARTPAFRVHTRVNAWDSVAIGSASSTESVFRSPQPLSDPQTRYPVSKRVDARFTVGRDQRKPRCMPTPGIGILAPQRAAARLYVHPVRPARVPGTKRFHENCFAIRCPTQHFIAGGEIRYRLG